MKPDETVANSGDDATVAGDLQSRIIIFIGQAIAIVEMPEDATAAIDAGKSFVGGEPGIACFIAGNGMNGVVGQAVFNFVSGAVVAFSGAIEFGNTAGIGGYPDIDCGISADIGDER